MKLVKFEVGRNRSQTAMKAAFAIALSAAVFFAPGAVAAGDSLDDAQIRRLLTGNSVVYEDGAKQFFGGDGATVYQIPGRPTERGNWRAGGDRYCSSWGPSGETCYKMQNRDGRITWDGKYPARIRAGDIFNPN